MSDMVEQAMEVIVRIKPLSSDEQTQQRCIFLSDCEEHTVLVESHNKRESFSFDYIAAEDCTQIQLYKKLGEPVLEDSFNGYNSCVFSYGQTGAGKTYSVLGQSTDLMEDPLSESRGLLPRLLEQMFQKINEPKNQYQQVNVRCSYLQIYNEQIIDLLTKESRNLLVREDIRRGVFVDGLTELSISNYEEALSIITKGLLVRKTSSTFMNSESSRSHTIFTILLTTQSFVNEVRKTVKSKLHIVDLAGSQRIKLTKVEGERLKQGCNINKSLLTLSHVISSLAAAGKKKKHIPFRDSKLTFFLKDSLGGNSKTKLLANISPRTSYIGDTISTLMFAKRVKIIKSTAKPNQNFADNFQSLRSEIRQLREELAQTKFIQTLPVEFKSNIRLEQSFIMSRDNFLPTQSFLESSAVHNNTQSLKILQQNEISYRAIVDQCLVIFKDNKKGKEVQLNFKKIFEEKKSLQRIVSQQQKLISNFPRFTQLFKQNLEYKRRIGLVEQELVSSRQEIQAKSSEIDSLNNNIELLNVEIEQLNSKFLELQKEKEDQLAKSIETSKLYDRIISSGKKDPIDCSYSGSHRTSKVLPNLQLNEFKVRRSSLMLTKRVGYRDIVERQNDMIDEYEKTIEMVKDKFQETVRELKSEFDVLEDMYHEQKKQKYEICKRKRKEPEMETLNNENQYLKLNIMDLEAEIVQLEENLFKKDVQIKTHNEEVQSLLFRIERNQSNEDADHFRDVQLQSLIDKIQIIKSEAEKANAVMNEEVEKYQTIICELTSKSSRLTKDNYMIIENQRLLVQQNNILREKLMEVSSTSVEDIFKDLEDSTQSVTTQQSYHQNILEEMEKLSLEKESIVIQKEHYEKESLEYKSLLEKSSLKILNLTKDLSIFRDSSAKYEQEVIYLSEKCELLEKQDSENIGTTRILEIESSKLRRENQRQEQLLSVIALELSAPLNSIVEQARRLKDRNRVLNEQNERLRTTTDQMKKKVTLIKNSKSMSNFGCLREPKQRQLICNRSQLQSNDMNRELIGEWKRKNKEREKEKETPKKNIIISSFHLEKDKGSRVVSKPLTQEGMNKVRKDSKNK